MPQHDDSLKQRTLHQVVAQTSVYPLDAFDFVQRGLNYTVNQVHGKKTATPRNQLHVSGQELCHGLREYALSQWGMLAAAVLRRWGITCTYDFGRIVFALIQAGMMQKTAEDSIEDFRNVYDFATAFETSYRISCGKL